MSRPFRRPAKSSGRNTPGPGRGTQKLQKVLADAGLGSRRSMEALVRSGEVTVNGVAAHVGARVGPRDTIKVMGKVLRRSAVPRTPRVLIYHKPEGEIVSSDDPGGRASVFERLPNVRDGKWLAVGRLDFNTSGLLILTTSGELANRMMHPRYELEREYAVRIRGRLDANKMERLTAGIRLEDGVARCESIEDGGGEGANHWYRLVIREGRNRVVRRLFAALGHTVSRLIRVRFGSVPLPRQLRRGQFLELTPQRVRELFISLELPRP